MFGMVSYTIKKVIALVHMYFRLPYLEMLEFKHPYLLNPVRDFVKKIQDILDL